MKFYYDYRNISTLEKTVIEFKKKSITTDKPPLLLDQQ